MRAAGLAPVAATRTLLTPSGAAAGPTDARTLAEAFDLPCVSAADLADFPRSV